MSGRDGDDLAMLALLREAALGRVFSAPADVYTTDHKVVITVELPGVPENAVAIETQNDRTLLVRGLRGFAEGGDAVDYYRLERTYGEFQCQVALPTGADARQRQVSLADGVLTVEIPRGTKANDRRDQGS
jgi:HSP20 family protein